MSNMSYCRFQNTASDMRDCLNHVHDELDPREQEAVSREHLAYNAARFIQELATNLSVEESALLDYLLENHTLPTQEQMDDYS